MRINKKILAAAAAALALAAVGLRWNGRKDGPSFEVLQVRRESLRLTVQATGVVQPQNRVEIKPPIAGRAEQILVREGESVRKGRILAWMSSVERAALLDAARAKGPEELAHWEDLYKPTPLIAPLDGLIISRSVEPGQTVTAQDAVLVMSNRLIVKAQVDETDIGRVRVRQEADILLDAYPEEEIPASVDHIAYEAKTVNNVTIYEVDVLPKRVPAFMRSGMTANVTFVVARKDDALILPAEAIRQEDGRATVLLPRPDGDGRPRRREIELGITDGKRVEVVSGLKEGDAVLVRSFRLPSAQTQSSPFSPWGRSRRQSGNRQQQGGQAGGQRGRGR